MQRSPTPPRMLPLACLLLPLLSCAGTSSTTPARAPAGDSPASPSASPEASDEKLVPLDRRITTGKLDNGITYYVLPHKKPEKRAYLRLVVNAGSVLEDEDQQGLAHFVEHMALNGTKRFPKQEIIGLLEKAGMQFGPHVNATTTFDETFYKLKVPTDDEALLDKSFQILRDWAADITFDPVEIDKERGVIIEEHRSRRNAWLRLFEKSMPATFHGSRYVGRLPIGKPEIIKGAPPPTLTRYYKDWYRTDLMAVIAVGDFDVPSIVTKIRREFGSLTPATKPRPRPDTALPAHAETLISIEADAEMPSTSVSINTKVAKRRADRESDFRRFIGEYLYHTMLNDRLSEIQRKPDAPFLSASSGNAGYVRGGDSFVMHAAAKEGEADKAATALLRELLRVERHGFTATELERAKKTVIRLIQQMVKERDKQDGSSFVESLQSHFLEGVVESGPEKLLELAERFLPSYTAAEISQLARGWIQQGSRVVVINGPDGKKLPAPAGVKALIAAAEKSEITPYDDGGHRGPLLAKTPTPGKVVKTTTAADLGVTEWVLSNGVRVLVKPTTFQNDQVLLRAISPGGTSVVKDADFHNADFAPSVTWVSGIGDFDATSLNKALSSKIASVNTSVDDIEESLNGHASPQDLQTMFELAYLAMTSPRIEEPPFRAWRERESEQARTRRLNPRRAFSEDFNQFFTRNHPRRRPITPEVIKGLDQKRAVELYKERFADADDFTFFIVGNVELPTLQPMVETYLGSLPRKPQKERFRDVGIKHLAGPAEKRVVAGKDPKSLVVLVFHGDTRFSREDDEDLGALADGLEFRLRERMREELGSVYGVNIGGYLVRQPRPEFVMQISFDCAPENVDKLRATALAEIEKVRKAGVSEEVIEKLRSARRRAHETNLKENSFWLGTLVDYTRHGEDPRRALAIDDHVKRLTSARLQALAKKYVNPKKVVAGILMPEAGAAPAPAKTSQKSGPGQTPTASATR